MKKFVKVVKVIDKNLVILFVTCPITGKTREVWGADEVEKSISYYESKGFTIIEK
jgi:hypothetical protein